MARGGLTKWFAEKWVDLSRPIYDEDGALVGFEPCGRHKAHEGPQGGAKHYPKCRPLREAMRMTERQRQDAIKRKRKVERKAEREGKAGPGSRAKMVSTYRGNPESDILPLYHGTSSKLLQKIREEGLSNPYLTSSREVARYYAEAASEEFGGRPRVLTVNSLDVSNLRVDYNAYEEPLSFYYKEWAKDDRDWYSKIEKGEIPYPSSDRDIETALEVTKSVKYEGTVAPAAIDGLGEVLPPSLRKNPPRPPIDPSKIRENKAEHVYIRRTPILSHKEGTKRKHHYWYTYDKNEAKKVEVKAKVGEKIKIPHNGQQGHYEVIGRLSDDVVGMIHDETHHAMAISDEALRELVKDVYHPDENLLPSEDVRYRHEKEDALPASRDSAYRAIQEASGIEDHDFAQADQEYREWKRNKGKKRKRPAPWRGGGMDIFESDLPRNKHFSCLLEAFEHATKGATTWRDIEPVLKMLQDVPGFENARFPDEVYERHVKHEAELEQQGYTIDVTLYGHTYSGLEGEDIKEVIFMASTIIPPGLQKGSGAEEAIGARDDDGGAVEDDMEEWGF